MMYAMHSDLKMQEEGEKMEGNILITGAKMVLPDGIVTGDLRITDGTISEISTNGNLEPRDDELIHDANGLHLLPGIIDPQVHSVTLDSQKKKTYTPAQELQRVVE